MTRPGILRPAQVSTLCTAGHGEEPLPAPIQAPSDTPALQPDQSSGGHPWHHESQQSAQGTSTCRLEVLSIEDCRHCLEKSHQNAH